MAEPVVRHRQHFGITTTRESHSRIAGANTDQLTTYTTRPAADSIDPRAIDLVASEVCGVPQGTLFGSSAMGGTVRLITRPAGSDPKLRPPRTRRAT